MNTVEIKKNIHNLVDSIENENLLTNIYNLLKNKVSYREGQLWDKLTNEEQEELLIALEESEKYENLIPHEDMKKKHKKWL